MFETQMTIVFRQRPYTVPGKCDVVPDTACAIGSESSLASVLKNCNWEKWYYPHWKIWAKNIFLSLEYSGLNIISSQISLAAGTVATMAPVALIVWPTRIARRDRWGYGHGHVGHGGHQYWQNCFFCRGVNLVVVWGVQGETIQGEATGLRLEDSSSPAENWLR